ncbi:hypothetical protein LshimejAT787_0801600 [Lyophyllum shimeji]|uniref:Arrestin-like N-terminal domain-containing protein n=1 Tax=Lyophyllum shimeji TaxID=47721 RepID=A0A9P3PRN3_LYOSH|nr:hypothetical protein LshimejAT787_0801600 [Lyophyllum shimeji]
MDISCRREPNEQPPCLPLFREGESIFGRVELDLTKAETFKGITIEVQAGTTAVGQEENRFLEMSETLWTPSGTSAKLNGRHSWPFNITLPREVAMSVTKGREGRKYRLPPNFTEKASPAYIDYRLVVTIKRSTFRVNQTLSTNFGYLPIVVPSPPSELRRLAYAQLLPLCGPQTDPEGWKILPPVTLHGTLFDVQKVEVECILAIATPLCYAPGSPLPLYLTLKSENTQALDILSSPSAVRLHLIRSLALGSDAAESTSTGRTDNTFVSSVDRAVFWGSGGQEDHRRGLEGELGIPPGLKPSFTFPRFTVKYHLELFPIAATGFRASGTGEGTILLTQEVAIATEQTPGVKPWSSMPPGYKRPVQEDYNKTVGFLENGNQRFLHHGH